MNRSSFAYPGGVALEVKLAWNASQKTWDLVWRQGSGKTSEHRAVRASVECDRQLVASIIDAVATELRVQEQERNGAQGWRAEYLDL